MANFGEYQNCSNCLTMLSIFQWGGEVEISAWSEETSHANNSSTLTGDSERIWSMKPCFFLHIIKTNGGLETALGANKFLVYPMCLENVY